MDPTTHDAPAAALALVRRGWEHLQLQRPLAAWACWQQAARLKPGDPAAVEALDRLARSAVLPDAAKAAHRFRPPVGEARRARWDAAMRDRDLSDLVAAATTFDVLAAADPADSAARFNRGLCLAWLGRNVAAIAALDRVIRLDAEADFEGAVAAWTLAEVLRHGAGAEELADDLNYGGSIPWPPQRGDAAELVPPACLRRVPFTSDPAVPPEDPPFEWLDRPMPGPSTDLAAGDLPRVLASLAARSGRLRYTAPDRELVLRFILPTGADFGRIAAEDMDTWERQRTVLPLNLLDASAFTFRLPPGLDADDRRRLTRAALADYYENRWIHQGRHGLGPADRSDDPGATLSPAEAAERGGAADRARLEGIIRLREQLARRPGHAELYAGYPFDRLRRRLGLEGLDPGTVEADDVACMGAAELTRLDPSTLDAPELIAAYRSARHLRRVPDVVARLAEQLARRFPGERIEADGS